MIEFGPPIKFRTKVTIKLPLAPGTVAPPEGSSRVRYAYVCLCVSVCALARALAHARVQTAGIRVANVVYAKTAILSVRVLSCARACAFTHVRTQIQCRF